MFDPARLPASTTAAIKQHAISCYPNEACGIITPALTFRSLPNVHADPTHYFDCAVACAELQARGEVAALVHSHPDGPEAPSGSDVAGQIHMDLPWGLLVCNATSAGEPWFWGDMLTPPPLEGREFRHGPSGSDGRGDCGALVRDWYRLERGIILPDFPRHDEWWLRGEDLYEQHFAAAGFEPVPIDQAQSGDVLLFQFRSQVANHGAIYLGQGVVLHHLGGRLSARESVIGWMKLLRRVLRHAG